MNTMRRRFFRLLLVVFALSVDPAENGSRYQHPDKALIFIRLGLSRSSSLEIWL
jgi:hypothetical protein